MSAGFDASRFDRAWARYLAAGARVHPQFKSYLAAGASEAEISASEQAVACEFPADLRYLLTLHNGSNLYQVLPGWELFSADRISDEWSVWSELYDDQFKPDGYDCAPTGPIRGDEWWRLRWIPFCGDGGGNHLCVDMEPADGGAVGQVITMWHDAPNRDVAAMSLTELIEKLADDLEAGVLTWDEDRDGVYEARS